MDDNDNVEGKDCSVVFPIPGVKGRLVLFCKTPEAADVVEAVLKMFVTTHYLVQGNVPVPGELTLLKFPKPE